MNAQAEQPINYIPVKDAAKRLKKTIGTIYRWLEEGRLSGIMQGNTKFVSEPSVLAMKKELTKITKIGGQPQKNSLVPRRGRPRKEAK